MPCHANRRRHFSPVANQQQYTPCWQALINTGDAAKLSEGLEAAASHAGVLPALDEELEVARASLQGLGVAGNASNAEGAGLVSEEDLPSHMPAEEVRTCALGSTRQPHACLSSAGLRPFISPALSRARPAGCQRTSPAPTPQSQPQPKAALCFDSTGPASRVPAGGSSIGDRRLRRGEENRKRRLRKSLCDVHRHAAALGVDQQYARRLHRRTHRS